MTVTMQNSNDESLDLVAILVKMVLASLVSGVAVAIVTPLGFLASLMSLAVAMALLVAHDELIKPDEPNPMYVAVLAVVSKYVFGAGNGCYFNMMRKVRRDMIIERRRDNAINNKPPKKRTAKKKSTPKRPTARKRTASKDNRTSAKKRSDALAGFGLGMRPTFI